MEATEIEITFITGAKAGETKRFSSERIILGSDDHADVLVPGKGVMSRHAMITLTSDGYRLYAISPDLTFVDEQPVQEPVLLHGTEEIRIGRDNRLSVKFLDSSIPRTRPTDPVSDEDSGKRGALRVVVHRPGGGEVQERIFRDAHQIVVGRSKSSDIILDDRRISNRHLVILAKGSRYSLVPESQHPPATKGGRAITTEEPIYPADSILLAEHELVFDLVEGAAGEEVAGTVPARLPRAAAEEGPRAPDRPQPGPVAKPPPSPPPELAPGCSPSPPPPFESGTPSGRRTPAPPSGPSSSAAVSGYRGHPGPSIELAGIDPASAGFVWKDTCPFMTFGSHPDCDVKLSDDSAIARLQAVLVWMGRAHVLYDRSEAGNTEVNREPVAGRPRSLESNDVLYFGPSRALTYTKSDAGSGELPPVPDFRLEALTGPMKGRVFRFFEETVTLGNHPDCSVALDEPELLGEHLRFQTRSSFGHELHCLDEEGVVVNGQRVLKSRLLRDGDVIALPGGHELAYHPARPAPGDIPALNSSRYVLHFWGAGRPMRDCLFSEPCLLVGCSALCDVLLESGAGERFELAVVLDDLGTALVVPRSPGSTAAFRGVPQVRPFRIGLGDQFTLRSGLSFQFAEVEAGHSSQPVLPPPSPLQLPTPAAQAPRTGTARELYTLDIQDAGEGGAPMGPVPILKEHVVVGRSEQCDVAFADTTMSRRQFEIVQEDADFVLKNLSTQGTYVGDQAVQSRVLVNGDLIRVGATIRIQFRLPRAVEPPARASGTLRYRLDFEAGELAGQSQEFAVASVVLGRQKGCQVLFKHPSVSRAAAEIVLRDAAHYLVLKGSNPVWVNGAVPQGEVRLGPGDKIEFPGDNRLCYTPIDADGMKTMPVPSLVPPEASQQPQGSKADEVYIPFRLLACGQWQRGREWAFCRDAVRMGRGPDCDLQVDRGDVSKFQALITSEFDRVVLENRSQERTRLNGNPAEGQVVLKDGDVITLAPGIQFEFRSGGGLDHAAEEAAIREAMEEDRTPWFKVVLVCLFCLLATWALLRYVAAK